MESGRKPIPFALLQLKGTARPERHGSGNEAASGTGAPLPVKPVKYRFPKPPRLNGKPVLGPVGMKEWRNVRRLLEASQTIREIDHAMLFGYCRLYETAITEPKEMTGSMWTQLRMFAAELGFSPSSLERMRRPIAD
jgi:phage terminase small subunit